MTTKQNISCKSENEQYSQEYPKRDNIPINILNDDCLGYVFEFLPIADIWSERDEYSILYIYIYIVLFKHCFVQTLFCPLLCHNNG